MSGKQSFVHRLTVIVTAFTFGFAILVFPVQESPALAASSQSSNQGIPRYDMALQNRYKKILQQFAAAQSRGGCAENLVALQATIDKAKSALSGMKNSWDVMDTNFDEVIMQQGNTSAINVFNGLALASSIAEVAIGFEYIGASAASSAASGELLASGALTAAEAANLNSALISIGTNVAREYQALQNGGPTSVADILNNIFNGTGIMTSLTSLAIIKDKGGFSDLSKLGGVQSLISAVLNLYTLLNDLKTNADLYNSLDQGIQQAGLLYFREHARLQNYLNSLEAALAKCSPADLPDVTQVQNVTVPPTSSLSFGYCDGLTCGNENSPSCIINAWIPQFLGGGTPPVLVFQPPYPDAKVKSVFIQATGQSTLSSSYWDSTNNDNWNTGAVAGPPSLGGDGALRIALAGSNISSNMSLSFRYEKGQVCGLSDEEHQQFINEWGSSIANPYTNYTVKVMWQASKNASPKDYSAPSFIGAF